MKGMVIFHGYVSSTKGIKDLWGTVASGVGSAGSLSLLAALPDGDGRQAVAVAPSLILLVVFPMHFWLTRPMNTND